jgi:GNAT superfamily N-acetyltransferase
MHIRPLHAADAVACDEIIASLPYFFGIDAGVRACAEAVRSQRGWVAEVDGVVRAFLTVDHPLPGAPEITWMASHAGWRRRGLGGSLVERAAAELATDGCRLLSVLTLAASVSEDGADTYAGTRDFYRNHGFVDVREILPVGWDEPALLLVRPLGVAHVEPRDRRASVSAGAG